MEFILTIFVQKCISTKSDRESNHLKHFFTFLITMSKLVSIISFTLIYWNEIFLIDFSRLKELWLLLSFSYSIIFKLQLDVDSILCPSMSMVNWYFIVIFFSLKFWHSLCLSIFLGLLQLCLTIRNNLN